MQKSKLGLDFEKVKHAKEVARRIADDVQHFVEGYSTVAVERTLCRLLGIDGIDANEVPLPNVLVNSLKEKGVLEYCILLLLHKEPSYASDIMPLLKPVSNRRP